MWQVVILNHSIYDILCSFFIYSVFGWIWETSKCSIQQRRFVNRGFLNGPIIPIYGFGGTLVYLILNPMKEYWYLVFLLGTILATVLEYITSVLMEWLFHAKWWDYSKQKYNFQGRICLMASFFWGVLSIADLYIFAPVVNSIIDLLSVRTGEIVVDFLLVLVGLDLIFTVIYTVQLDHILVSMQKLREELHEYLLQTNLAEEGNSFMKHLPTLTIDGLREKSKEYRRELQSKFMRKLDKGLTNTEKEAKLQKFHREMEERFNDFFTKYSKHVARGNCIQRRLLKAFPTLQFKRRADLVEDIKARLEKHREK